MRTLSALLLLAASPAHALPTESIELGAAGHARVSAADELGARLSFELPDGQPQSEEELGEEFASFRVEAPKEARKEADVRLATRDLDGDGRQEVVVRTKLAGGAGGLYVFLYDVKEKRFRAATSDAGEDFLPVERTAPVRLRSDGHIEVGAARAARAYRLAGFQLSSIGETPPAAATPPRTLPLPLELRGWKP